jgi:hypothetical protein
MLVTNRHYIKKYGCKINTNQLAESIQLILKDSVIKKIDKDNFLDIHLPSINSSKGTHLFFNTAKGQIKLGFYVRDLDFINKIMLKSSKHIETYSQGLRLNGNPEFETVEQAIGKAKDFLQAIDLNAVISKKVKKNSKPKKKVSTKPLSAKPKKVNLPPIIIESIPENVSTISTSQNNSKNNWYTRLILFFGKYIFRK